MNILIFTSVFHPSIGGLENQTLTFIYEFLRKGHKVKVIVIQFEEITSRSGEPPLKDIDIYYKPGYLKKLKLFGWADLVYMPNISLKVIWFIFLRPFKKWVISHNDFYLSDKRNIRVRIKRLLITFASRNIAVSNAVANYLNNNSTIVYNCYDNEVFKIYNDEKKNYDFVFLGRLVEQKGCALLIKACATLKDPFFLNIIGDGPQRPILEQMVKDLGLEQNIQFLGLLQGECLARTLNRHKIMVIPSIDVEGFPLITLEGLACGCRLIASDAGGLPEAVREFGKIFKMNDQQELETLLATALKESRETEHYSISENLTKYLVTRRKQAVAQEYLSLFE